MIDSIQIARQIYPNSKIGYYGYPGMPYWTDPNKTRKAKNDNDQMIGLYQELDVLLPSIYIPYVTNDSVVMRNNINYVNRKTEESIRIRNKLIESGFDPIPIYHYTWYKYHSGDPILNNWDTWLEFFKPIQYRYRGVDGIVIWGNEGSSDGDKNATKYFNKNAWKFKLWK